LNPTHEQVKAHFLYLVAEKLRNPYSEFEIKVRKLPFRKVSISTLDSFPLRGVGIGKARFIFSHDQIVAAGIKLKALYGLTPVEHQHTLGWEG